MQKYQELYSDKKFKEAAAEAIKLVNGCPCGIKYRDTPCLCKDIVKSIENEALKDELKKRCICSAKSSRRCTNAKHLDLLDKVAAALEQAKRLDQAIVCAAQMINLSPRQPLGYLRLGKLLRLKGEHFPAYRVYQQGITLVQEKYPQHERLVDLRRQQDKTKTLALREDPMSKLPFELICMIFSHVTFRTLCRLLHVSKAWRRFLTAKDSKNLWYNQRYSYPNGAAKSPVQPKTLLTYLAFADRQVSSITIDSCKYFGLRQPQMELILTRFSNLKHLRIRGSTWSPLKAVPSGKPLPQLETLYLGLGVQVESKLVTQLLRSSDESLTELSIFDLPASSTQVFEWPRLQCLQVIRLATGGRRGTVDLFKVLEQTPNAEEIWLDDMTVNHDAPGELIWPRARSLFVGEEIVHAGTLVNFYSPKDTMRELFLEGNVTESCLYHTDMEYLSDQMETPSVHAPEKLSLVTNSSLDISRAEAWLLPAFASGNLKELELSHIPEFVVEAALGSSPWPPWFRCETLDLLAISGFSTSGWPKSKDDLLLEILERFPNLKRLDTGKESFSDSTLGGLIKKKGGIRTIYHQHGRLKDDLREWAARKYGAAIINGPYPSPSQLPDRPLVSRRLAQGLKRARNGNAA